MKQRLVNKKLNADVLLELWAKHWCHTIDLAKTISPFKDDISKARYAINQWMMNYELNQMYEVAVRRHNIKYVQFYKYLFHNRGRKYKPYKYI